MIVFKASNLQKLNITLNENILSHCQKKYKGEMLTESIFAYQTLALLYKEKTGKELPEITFLDGGKPTCKDINISLSHSGGAVAVGFSTDKGVDIGVDIELIKAKKPQAVKLLGLDKDCTDTEFYLAWTKKETLKKACNKPLLSAGVGDFVGESKVININCKDYAVSVYSKESYESNF